MLRALCLAAIVTGCGRIAFDPLADASAIDDSCWPLWRDGVPALSPAEPVSSVNLGAVSSENNPFVAADGLTLHFVSNRSGPTAFWRATRATTTAPFGGAQLDPFLSSPSAGTVQLSGDGLAAYISDRPDASADFDLQLGTRTSTSAAFALSPALVANLNTAEQEFDAHPSADGLRLYFCRSTSTADIALWVADRAATTEPFAAPTRISGLDTPTTAEADPFLSPDERVIVFSSDRNAGVRQLWTASRPDRDAAFDPPRLVDVSSTMYEQDSALTADGCEVWFTSAAPGSLDDLYVARVIR